MTEYTDEELLELYQDSLEGIEFWREKAGRYEWEIRKRMEGRGSTAIPGDTYVCEVVQKNSYDQQALAPLKEILSALDLAACLYPAHQETGRGRREVEYGQGQSAGQALRRRGQASNRGSEED